MTYKTVKDFRDLQDNLHLYRAGDTYPRTGVKVNRERVNELLRKKLIQHSGLAKSRRDAGNARGAST